MRGHDGRAVPQGVRPVGPAGVRGRPRGHPQPVHGPDLAGPQDGGQPHPRHPRQAPAQEDRARPRPNPSTCSPCGASATASSRRGLPDLRVRLPPPTGRRHGVGRPLRLEAPTPLVSARAGAHQHPAPTVPSPPDSADGPTVPYTRGGDGARPNRRHRLMTPTGRARDARPEGATMPSDRDRLEVTGPEAPLRVVAIAAGGALGTLARYGADRALVGVRRRVPVGHLPRQHGRLVAARRSSDPGGRAVAADPLRAAVRRHRLLRGFTTFSTLAVEAAQRAQHGRVGRGHRLPGRLTGGGSRRRHGRASTVARGRLLPVPRSRPLPDPDDTGAPRAPARP